MRLRRRIRSQLSRLLGPHYGRCYRCRTTFWGPVHNERHQSWYQVGPGHQRGVFPLCEPCWQELTIEERLHFYDKLLDDWIKGGPRELAGEYEGWREPIHEAVRAGG